MKRLAALVPLVALSLTLLTADRAHAQRRGGRPAPPAAPTVMLPVPRTPSTVPPAATFPSQEFRLPPDSGRSSPFDAGPRTYAPRYAPRYDGRSRPLRPYYPYGYAYGYRYDTGTDGAPIYAPDNANTGAAPYPEADQPAASRGDWMPAAPAPGPVATPDRRGPDTFYVIPGCYLGNRPPREVSLPPGCDLKKVRTIKNGM